MNKRWFALILMIAVIPGCSERRIETTPSYALYETKPRDDLGFSYFYMPEDPVRVLPPDIRDADRFCFLGKDILVFSGYPETRLTLLDGDTFAAKSDLRLSVHADVNVTAAGITYTDELTRELVFLDSGLSEARRLPLPVDCGGVLLSADAQSLYYCTSDALRVLNLTDGTDRPLREMHFPIQEITGLHCSDLVVGCRILADDGSEHSLFVCAETGRLLHDAVGDVPLWTEEDLYFAIGMDGPYRQLISGSGEVGPSVLVTEAEPDSVTPVLSRKLVLLHTQQADGSRVLNAYHLETGCHTAQITLAESWQVTDIQPDPHRNGLWLLCHDREEERDILRYWDMAAAVPEGSQNCLQPLWSSDNPDLAGLEECRQIASALSEKYGVQIHIGPDIPADAGSKTEPEYQVPLLRRMLLELDNALTRYPDGFLSELAEQTENGRLDICLVRSISPADPAGLLHWDPQGDIYLLLTPTPDLEQQAHRLLFELIDCRVLSRSNAYDNWDRAAPTGSGHRERVQILEAAVAEGCSESFASAVMQNKLRQICLGIRDAFHTAKTAPALPWEQYLAEPI